MRHWPALILAGGAGRRFGGRKLLASLGGQPLIRRVTNRVLAGGFGEVLVVTGADDAAVRGALQGAACRIIHASDWEDGMAATLRQGIAALSPDVAGVCVFLGDMPLVPVSHCTQLIVQAEQAGYAARAVCDGRPGHPVAFTRAAFADLARLRGDQGANALLKARDHGVAVYETGDRGALIDIDTLDDLAGTERALNVCATSATIDSATSRGVFPNP